MRKTILLAAVLLASAATAAGCSNGGDDGRVLSDGGGRINEVANFSSYKDTEIPTEKQTEPPPPPPTEKQTEPPPPPPTEKQTEPQTDPPEVPHSEDYDFSDFKILQAAFKYKGGLGSIPYLNTVEQDPESMTRTQTVESTDGTVKVVLKADRTSGSTNKEVSIEYSSEDARNEILGILASFDCGITSENAEKFMAGGYSGPENAPLIGLADASVSVLGDKAAVRLVKNAAPEGDVPFWTDAPLSDLTALTGSEKVSGTLTEDNDVFLPIFKSIEFAEVKRTGLSSSDGFKTVSNENGEVLETQAGFSAQYESSSGNRYEVRTESGEDGKSRIVIEASCTEKISKERLGKIASRVWEAFYDGTKDLTPEQGTGKCSADRLEAEITDGGFQIRIG